MDEHVGMLVLGYCPDMVRSKLAPTNDSAGEKVGGPDLSHQNTYKAN